MCTSFPKRLEYRVKYQSSPNSKTSLQQLGQTRKYNNTIGHSSLHPGDHGILCRCNPNYSIIQNIRTWFHRTHVTTYKQPLFKLVGLVSSKTSYYKQMSIIPWVIKLQVGIMLWAFSSHNNLDLGKLTFIIQLFKQGNHTKIKYFRSLLNRYKTGFKV